MSAVSRRELLRGGGLSRRTSIAPAQSLRIATFCAPRAISLRTLATSGRQPFTG